MKKIFITALALLMGTFMYAQQNRVKIPGASPSKDVKTEAVLSAVKAPANTNSARTTKGDSELTYCTGSMDGSIGVGGGTYMEWAAAFRPSMYTADDNFVTSVDFFAYRAATYTLKIYDGDPAAAVPADLLYTHDYEVAEVEAWVNLPIYSAVVEIDHTKALWVAVGATAPDYPATYSDEVLTSTDCCMMYFQGEWNPITALGSFSIQPWMIVANTTSDEPAVTCEAISTFPYFNDFENFLNEKDCWISIDNDGDGQDWITGTTQSGAFNGYDSSTGLVSKSYDYNGSSVSYDADNYLLSPEFELPAGYLVTLSWYAMSTYAPSYPDHYEVMIAPNGSTDTSDFVSVFSEDGPASWAQRTADISAYAGTTVRVVFHHQDYDNYWIVIDNLGIETAFDCSGYGFPFAESFENGLDCWGNFDEDGDGYTWQLAAGNTGNGAQSVSWSSATSSLNPDNWLVSPEITIPSGLDEVTLAWKVKGASTSYKEHYGVYVSTTGDQPADFTTQVYEGQSTTTTWADVTVDMTAYAGQTIRIAFRHYDSYDKMNFIIDDISIKSPLPCNDITEFPYFNDFENFLDEKHCWIDIDNDGDGYGWFTDTQAYGTAGFGVDGSNCLISQSYDNNVGARNADNYLLSPEVVFPANSTITLSWFEQSVDGSYPDSYEVMIAPNGSTEISDFVSIYSGVAAGSWTERTADISAYAGTTVRVVFHHQSSDCYILGIDNMSITLGGSPEPGECTITTFPYFNDFENFASEVECWVSIDNDGDGEDWLTGTAQSGAFNGYNYSSGLVSKSYNYDEEAGVGTDLDADNYLVSPEFVLPANGTVTLSWYAMSTGGENWPDYYEVMIAPNGSTEISDFVSVLGEDAPIDWTQRTVDISSYAGTTVRVVFHHQDYAQYWVVIDNLGITVGSSPAPQPGLHVVDAEDNFDVINMGPRPASGWMRPYAFTMTYDGENPIAVSVLDFTPNDGYFTMVGVEYPINFNNGDEVELFIATGESDEEFVERQFVAIYEGTREAAVWDITAEPYTPEEPDMWEVARVINDAYPFEYRDTPTEGVTLHDNYLLPGDLQDDGPDAVYKVTFDQDVLLNGTVTKSGHNDRAENGKMAIYTEGFNGVGGPDANNNYTGPMGQGGPASEPYDVIVGDGTVETPYTPLYCYYNYRVSEQLYLASELEEMGMSAGPINTIGFYNNVTSTSHNATAIKIWMGNVDDVALTSTSMDLSAMTLVFEGGHQVTSEWNDFELNGAFSWDGTHNLVVIFQDNTGSCTSYSTYPYWAATYCSTYMSAYSRNDDNAYDLEDGPQYMTQSNYRANTHFVGGGRNREETEPEYIINNMTVIPGTYYIAASSTDSIWDVVLNATELPCPEMADNPSPADDADDLEPASVNLNWNLGEYTTEYRLVFGSTYYCEDVLVDWTTNLAQSFTVSGLYNNTNYFWRVDERNSNCETLGEVWGFTTHLNVPRNLTADDYALFEGESVVLSWTAIQDRTYRYYNIYQDDELIYSTPANQVVTNYTVEGLTYNMDGYSFYVTAVYDEGESAPSNEVIVKVSGNGNVAGHVYEQDSITGIANATVTFNGIDEFGDEQTINFITDGTGAYGGEIKAGTYTSSASCPGYNPMDAPLCGNPIDITYGETTAPVDFVLDENFLPVADVIAEYYPDPSNPESPYVKVYWGFNPISMLIEDFETGDFSHNNWEFPTASYPWEITTSHPYEGTYCMQSGGYHVSSVTSTAQVTINAQRDCKLSFYSMISCESTFDKGTFYIDGVQKGTVTGTSSWTLKQYNIAAGTHTLSWTYTKDSSVDSGEDRWFIDYICLENNSVAATADRAFKHFRVYRTDCYQDSPYTEGNTVVLACELQDTVYIDVSWPDATPGVYKWGVGVVYEGNRESEITWSEPTAVPTQAMAETATRRELTICDDGTTNEYVPVYGLFADAYLKCEYIIPATEISAMNGEEISKMKFYLSSPASAGWGDANFKVFMKEVANTTISAYTGYADATVVYQGALDGTQDEMDVNFTTPYTYHGGNLLIGFYNETIGTWKSASFYGQEASNACVQGYSYSSLGEVSTNVRNFLPKTTFTYSGGGQGGGTIAGDEPIQEPRESPIVWSNCLDKDMYLGNVSVNVLLNSADSPEGTTVTFTNLNEAEQGMYPIDPIILDGTGYYAFDSFRRGDYNLKIQHEGYYDIEVEVSIWRDTELRYVMTEILNGVDANDIYVSRTGWAMWEDIDRGQVSDDKSGDRHFQYYKVMCTSIDNVPIYNHNTVVPMCQLDTNDPYQAPLVEGDTYLCKVAVMYSTGMSEWSEPVAWVYEPCDHWGPVDFVELVDNNEGNHIHWEFNNGFNPYAPDLNASPMTPNANDYATESGMLRNGVYAFNITDIANFDERVFFLHNLMNDGRFNVINGEAAGMFVISANEDNMDLEEAVNDFIFNNANEFAMMDKVQAAQVANAYKSTLPSHFVNSLMMDFYAASRENNLCELALPFCTDNGMYEFPAGVNAGSGENGPDYDCLYTTPNPAWYYMKIADPGDMDIYMYSTPAHDIDFCCWGPFDDPLSPCPNGLTYDKVVSCSYSADPTEHCMIPANAQTGEYYILVITNYSNQPCNINFSKVSGSGSTDCGILPPVDIIGFLVTRDGEYLDIVGPTVRDYTDADEYGSHNYCVRPIYPGEQNLPDHNYGWSMGCPVCSNDDCAAPSHLEGTYEWRNGQYGALISWVTDSRNIVSFNIYRSINGINYEMVGSIDGNKTEYFDAVEIGTYYYQVTAISDCGESVPALTANGANFVIVAVTGIDENGGVTMYPNPTNGNVKIVANAMNHITVVSSLGQVVYDADVDCDEMNLNMAQFNAGIYTVRIATESGVSVQRLTVVR